MITQINYDGDTLVVIQDDDSEPIVIAGIDPGIVETLQGFMGDTTEFVITDEAA